MVIYWENSLIDILFLNYIPKDIWKCKQISGWILKIFLCIFKYLELQILYLKFPLLQIQGYYCKLSYEAEQVGTFLIFKNPIDY